MKYLILLVVIAGYAFTSDEGPEKHYRAFQQWYSAHHEELVLKHEQNGLLFELRYLPNEVTICQELLQATSVSKKQIKALYTTYDNYDEYSFKMLAPGVKDLLIETSEDKAEITEKQFYLIESIQQDFLLIRDGDTLHPVRCHYENNYGTAPFIQLHLAFNKPTGKVKSQQLRYNDQLFGTAPVQFDLTPITKLQIPKIK